MQTAPAVGFEGIRVSTLEGKPVYGGELIVKPLVQGDEMVLMRVFYRAGVGTPLHSHTHESIVYLISGKLRATLEDKEFMMMPGDVCRHPKGVLHGLEAIEDSVIVECKSPAPDLSTFMAAR